MSFTLTRDAEEFTARAGRLLEGRVDYNVLATVLMNVQDGRHAEPPPLFAYGTDPSGEVVWGALRTPPWPMLAGGLEPDLELEPEAAGGLLALWLAEDPHLPGVSGQPCPARAIARGWSANTGRPTRCRISMAMHALDGVRDPPRPASGQLRVAGPGDRPLLLDWWRGFVRDSGVIEADPAAAVDARLYQRGLLVWEDGAPVSMVGITRPVAGVVRLGPVYTPEAARRRGYAGTAVAAVSRRALAAGARTCILFTDLANPTSNKIYAEVGYRRFADWEEHEFGP